MLPTIGRQQLKFCRSPSDFDTLIWPPNDDLNWPPEEENLLPWISFRAYEPAGRPDWTGEPKWNYSNRFDGSTTTGRERSKEWPENLGSTGAWYGKPWGMRDRGSERSRRVAGAKMKRSSPFT